MSEWSRNSAHGPESYFSMSSMSFTPSQHSSQPANQSVSMASSSSSSASPALSLSSKDFPALPSKSALFQSFFGPNLVFVTVLISFALEPQPLCAIVAAAVQVVSAAVIAVSKQAGTPEPACAPVAAPLAAPAAGAPGDPHAAATAAVTAVAAAASAVRSSTDGPEVQSCRAVCPRDGARPGLWSLVRRKEPWAVLWSARAVCCCRRCCFERLFLMLLLTLLPSLWFHQVLTIPGHASFRAPED